MLSTVSLVKYHLGLAKAGLDSEMVLISSGLNNEILLYMVRSLWCWLKLDKQNAQ